MLFSTWLAAALVYAHQPNYGGTWDSPDSAYEVQDPDISIVVYRDITCESPELWLTFDAVAGEDVWVQLGVPVIDRLDTYRPAMAVFGPGLPDLSDDVPFPTPEGLGGVMLESDASPSEFFEPFTGTSSWIYKEEWVTMPEDGPSYVVAWDPSGTTGKLWVAMGVIEDFSDVDWSEAASWDEDVNNFHETGKYEPAPQVEESTCALQEDDSAADPVEGTDSDNANGQVSGCQTAPGFSPGGAALPLLMLLAFRRRTS